MSDSIPTPRATCPADYGGEYDENGVDLSLIRYLLSLTPRERIIRMNEASRGAYQLYEYGRRNRQARSVENR
jgi:hypothetical protein